MVFFFYHPAVSSYINWGRKTCPQVNGTKLLYSGKLLENKKKYYGFKEKKTYAVIGSYTISIEINYFKKTKYCYTPLRR